jgi:hypothetical protein
LFEVEEETSVKASKVPGYAHLYVRSAFASMTKPRTKVSEHQARFYPNNIKASIDHWDLVEADVESLSWEAEQL